LGGYHGAYRFDGEHFSHYGTAEGLPPQGVWCFREDVDGTFFVGTMHGLYRMKRTGEGYRFTKDGSFGSGVVYDMCLDREGNLWFASAPGLRRLIRGAELLDFPGSAQLANAGIGPIEQDGKSHVYFGSRNSGLYRLEGNALERTGSEAHLLTRTITAILPRGHTHVYVALWRTGVCLLSGTDTVNYTKNSGLPSDNVHALAALEGGTVMAGTAAGVCLIMADGTIPPGDTALTGMMVFDLRSPRRRTPADGRPDTVWAGTNDGVRVLTVRGDSIAVAPPGPLGSETAGRIVYAVLPDSKGRLWAGTDGAGVVVRDSGGLSRFTAEDGLAGDRVFALAEDSLGDIWIGTSSGLSCYSGGGFRNLGYTEGFGETGVHGLMADAEGSLWVSAYPGVRRLRPVRFPVSTAPPPLYLTDVQVDSSHLSLGGEHELQADPAVITFRFAALSYSDERLVRYRYRLDGFDRQWSQPEVAREVRYTHLPSGRYTFRVIGRGGNGVWTAKEATFSFTILPPLWARWWFIACALLLVAGSAYGMYRYRLGKLLELERTRSRIAMDLHDDIGSSLTRISVMTEVAGRQSSTDPQAARSTLEPLSDIVWTVDPKQDTLQNVIRRISQFGQELCEGRGIAFETDLAGSFDSTRLTPERRRDIYLVFKEGIHNIVKHSGATRARFTVRPIPHGALLELVDDGTGIPDGSAGSGHGLKSLRERGSRAGTNFSQTSRQGEGTRIHIEVKTG
jgi:streptogramin lyase